MSMICFTWCRWQTILFIVFVLNLIHQGLNLNVDKLRHFSKKQDKLIIDSDGGADDATAILIVLNDPNVNVLAITCVYGNVNLNQSCDNIRRTLQLVDKADKIPVYPGCDGPFLTTAYFDNFYGVDGLGNASQQFPLPKEPLGKEHASNIMVQLANQYPGEISILAIAPLTNLAVALKIDSELPSKLKEVAVMGGTLISLGNVQPGVAEFNMYDDAEAAKMVVDQYTADCRVTIMPYELCLLYSAPWAWFDQWVSSNSTVAFFLSEIWVTRESDPKSTEFECCDCLAVTAFLYPEVVNASVTKFAGVETCGELTRGQLVVDHRKDSTSDPNVLIYKVLNEDAVLDKWDDIVNQ